MFARASWRRKREDGPGCAQNELGSGKVGRVGTAIVAVPVIVDAFRLADSVISYYTVGRYIYGQVRYMYR